MSARSPLRPWSLTRIDTAILNGSAAQRIVLPSRRRRRHVTTNRDRIGRTSHGSCRVSWHPGRRRRHARFRWNCAGRLTSIRICGHRRRSTLTRCARHRRRRGRSGLTRRHSFGCRRLSHTVRCALSDRNASGACGESQHGGTCKHDRFHRVILSCSSPRSASWRMKNRTSDAGVPISATKRGCLATNRLSAAYPTG